jgi:hypothetical protein
MDRAKPISAISVATVSGLVFGAVGVLAAPWIAFLVLSFAMPPAQFSASIAGTDHGMVLAVMAPAFCAMIGFTCGLFMASMFNLFVRMENNRQVVHEQPEQARAATLSDVA